MQETYPASVAAEWSDPNVRAEIKMELALRIARHMRVIDVIDYVVTETATGETLVTASVMVARTGDEK